MKRRYIRFDMNALAQTAAQAVGAESCVSVQKCPDGMYNKTFVLTMSDGRDIVAKVPNPNAGFCHDTTVSEVATMDFARNTLRIPVPKIYAWNSRADDAVGAEYIIMERMPGVQLAEVWKDMKLVEKMQLRLNLATYQETWLSISFGQYGALYYKKDLEGRECSVNYLYQTLAGEKVYDSRFAIGPTTGREWFDCGRGTLKCDRGPWTTASQYRRAIGFRESAAVASISPLPKQTVMLCGPGLYRPDAAKKSSAIQSYLKIHDVLLPNDPSITAPYLWHDDLHEENIFVDPNDPARILGIIDWQSVDLRPLCDHDLDPAFVQYPGSKPTTLEVPELEGLSGLSDEERARVTQDYFNRALFIASRRITSKKLPTAYRGLQYQQTTAFDLLTIARRLFEFGEAQFRALTVQLRNKWPVPASTPTSTEATPCPLAFDDASLASIQDDVATSARGMAIMDDIRTHLGPLWPDKHAVSHEHYDEAKDALRQVKTDVLAAFARSEHDASEIESWWPFDD